MTHSSWITMVHVLAVILLFLTCHGNCLTYTIRAETFNYTNLILQYFLVCGPDYMCDVSSFNSTLLPDRHYSDLDLCPKCFCDRECVLRGDCCPDVFFNMPEQNCVNITIIAGGTDRSRTDYSYALMVDSCPVASDPELRSKCVKTDELVKRFEYLPVTSSESLLTYQNKYCAQCYGETNYTVWSLDFFCEEFSDFNFVSTIEELVSQAFDKRCIIQSASELINGRLCKTDNVQFSSCNKTKVWDELDKDVLYGCEANFHGQFRMFKNIFCYICNPAEFYGQTVDTCNSTGMWTPYDQGLQMGCKSFPYTVATKPYKNVFCFLCNRNNTVKGGFVDATANISEISGSRVPLYLTEVPVFWYNISVTQFNGNYFKSFLRKHFAENPNFLMDIYPGYNRHIFEPVNGTTINTTIVLHKVTSLNERVSLCNQNILPEEYRIYSRPCNCDPVCFYNVSKGHCCDDIALRYPAHCLADRFVSTLHNTKREEASRSIYVTSGCFSDRYPDLYGIGCKNGITNIFSLLPVSDLKSDILYSCFFCFLCNRIGYHSMAQDLQNNPRYFENQTATYEEDLNLEFESLFLDPWDLEIKCFSYVDYSHFVLLGDLIDNIWKMPCNITYKPETITGSTNLESSSFKVKECEEDILYNKCNITSKWPLRDPNIAWACDDISKGSLANWIGYTSVANVVYKNKYCGICNPVRIDSPLIDKCNVTGRWRFYDLNTEKACLYFPMIFYFSPYKNKFCARCNGNFYGIIGSAGPIIPPPYDGIYFRNITWVPVFRNLFSIEAYEDMSTKTDSERCSTGQIFDNTKNLCRNITCYPGKYVSNSSCRALLPVTENLRYTLAFDFNGSVNSNMTITQMMDGIVQSVRQEIMTNLRLLNDPVTEYYIVSDQPCASRDQKLISMNFSGTLYISLFVDEKIPRVETENKLIEIGRRNITHIINRVSFDIHLNQNAGAFLLPLQKYRKSFETECFIYQLVAADSNMYYEKYHSVIASEILTCTQVELDRDEVEVDATNLRIQLQHSTSFLDYHQYDIMPGDKVRLCVNDFMAQLRFARASSESESLTEEYRLYIVSLFCTAFSLLCILITLTTYCVFESLRSTPGKTNMGLISTLFVTVLLYQIGIDKTQHEELCIISGVLLHYFWLSSFLWMQICSFHMYRIFRSNHIATSHGRDNTIRWYCLFAFLTPFLVIAFNVSIIAGLTRGNKFGYGEVKCFISGQTSFIMSFLIPVILICLSNIYFFVFTLVTIIRVPAVESTKKNREEFQVYLKLFTVTGILWIFQIVDTMIPLSAFSYVISVLNSLQGVFIFLAFTCNKRIWTLYQLKFKCIDVNGAKVKYTVNSKTTKTSETSM